MAYKSFEQFRGENVEKKNYIHQCVKFKRSEYNLSAIFINWLMHLAS